MRAFVLACLTAAVLALAAAYVLNMFQEPVEVAFSTTGVRI